MVDSPLLSLSLPIHPSPLPQPNLVKVDRPSTMRLAGDWVVDTEAQEIALKLGHVLFCHILGLLGWGCLEKGGDEVELARDPRTRDRQQDF